MKLDTQIALALTAPDTFEKVHKNIINITDEFAIGFAEWAIAKNMGVNKFTLYEGELEIYKKEKGL